MESPREELQICLSVRIPLRDGIRLSAILYLPTSSGVNTPRPAIFTLTPYIAQTHHEQGIYFATHGFPFLSVDVRGRGDSEGEFNPIFNDAEDGHDIIEWIARQPYCNGSVAMWGGSYMGYTQWAAAKGGSPHLKSLVPVASPFRGGDSPLRTNIFVPYSMQWLTYLWGRTSHDRVFSDQKLWNGRFRKWFESGKPFRELDTFLGSPSSIFQEWLSHPHRDAYWDAGNPTAAQYANLDIPILTITGTYDGNQTGALLHYREHMKHAPPAHRARHYLIIGPWDHAGTRIPKLEFAGVTVGPASLVDLPQLNLDWYAWTLQGAEKPAFLQKNVAYYVMGADRWRYADTLEDVTARSTPLYLDSATNPTDVFKAGSLVSQVPRRCEPDHYIHDPRDMSLAAFESTIDPDIRTDHRMIYASAGKLLVYHSQPFERDTEISGFFRFLAWIAIDQPDTDFRVSVYEVGLDGSALQLTSDWMRARYRESLYEEQLVETTEPLCYPFDRFTFVSKLIPRGHFLRLVLAPIHSIFVQRNFNSGGVVAEESVDQARAVTVKLFHDPAHASALYVPLGHPEP